MHGFGCKPGESSNDLVATEVEELGSRFQGGGRRAASSRESQRNHRRALLRDGWLRIDVEPSDALLVVREERKPELKSRPFEICENGRRRLCP